MISTGETETSPVCLISGGSDGIGLATAKLFASHGYRVAICGRDQEKLEAASESIMQLAQGDAGCLTNECDLTDDGEAQHFAELVFNEFGRVDVLVNNAAAAPLAPFDQIDSDVFEKTISLNIRSLFYLTQTTWKQMLKQGRGVVVNISSLAAIDPFPGFSLYGSTKAWVDLLTVALAGEGKENNIRTYSIRPGAVETKLLRGLFPDFPADQCVSPERIANEIWACVTQPDKYPSGSLIPVTNQP